MVNRHVLTDEQLNAAIVVTRTTPALVGLYVVSVGCFAGGVPGAVAAWAAMVTPALLIVPLIHFMGRQSKHPRVKGVLQSSFSPVRGCSGRRLCQSERARSADL